MSNVLNQAMNATRCFLDVLQMYEQDTRTAIESAHDEQKYFAQARALDISDTHVPTINSARRDRERANDEVRSYTVASSSKQAELRASGWSPEASFHDESRASQIEG
jgi:hypothetical protein